MKTFYIIFRLLLIANILAAVLIVVSNEYNDHINIALSFYSVFMVVVHVLLNEVIRDYKALQERIRELNNH